MQHDAGNNGHVMGIGSRVLDQAYSPLDSPILPTAPLHLRLLVQRRIPTQFRSIPQSHGIRPTMRRRSC
jgi:hypothetical protein